MNVKNASQRAATAKNKNRLAKDKLPQPVFEVGFL